MVRRRGARAGSAVELVTPATAQRGFSASSARACSSAGSGSPPSSRSRSGGSPRNSSSCGARPAYWSSGASRAIASAALDQRASASSRQVGRGDASPSAGRRTARRPISSPSRAVDVLELAEAHLTSASGRRHRAASAASAPAAMRAFDEAIRRCLRASVDGEACAARLAAGQADRPACRGRRASPREAVRPEQRERALAVLRVGRSAWFARWSAAGTSASSASQSGPDRPDRRAPQQQRQRVEDRRRRAAPCRRAAGPIDFTPTSASSSMSWMA